VQSMKNNNRKLTFIYNSDSGFLNGLMDSAHKLISPKTYSCDLCALTYGSFGIKKEWKNFMLENDLEIEFFHKNDMPSEYKDLELPIILDEDKAPFISVQEMGGLVSLQDFIELFKKKLI